MRFSRPFARPDLDSLLVHWKATPTCIARVQRIKALGKRAGVVIQHARHASGPSDDVGGDDHSRTVANGPWVESTHPRTRHPKGRVT